MLRKRIEPGPGQESVWDYPRPPRLEDSQKLIQVVFNGIIIANTRRAKRILETSHPPAYYIPPEDVKMEYFIPTPKHSYCEWKGQASYYTITVDGKSVPDGAWYYPQPTRGYESIANYIAVYPSLMEACYVNREKVQPQEGDFYGGWITKDIVGPFKGGRGTFGW
ncbi:hypothetical protein KDA_13210 [Dictyobacter alpinus]|uniref:DUF427 domain-containing protein n=1 Tax=Dictyobacter alpinus TaxID=2014873 RepID=A0A402B3E9_9CHLR|nr:DUF427 domain-containing protein [Dictyobacter alpinus]GCE25837.1 hypothetical protein KDA_13210 [Dictyobacter alpinus]